MLADRVAVWAAEEARRLVHTAAGLVHNGDSQHGDPQHGDPQHGDPHHGDRGVLAAIERAAQHPAAQIGLAAVAGAVDWAGTHTPALVCCPDPDHAEGPDADRAARLVARRTKTVRTLLGRLEVIRGYYHCDTGQPRVRAAGRPVGDRRHQPVTRSGPSRCAGRSRDAL